MFLPEKAPGELQAPPKITKLSQAIMAGHPLIGESCTCFANTLYTPTRGCSIGAAAVGLGWEGYMKDDSPIDFLKKRLGVSERLIQTVSNLHVLGLPRVVIARVLRVFGN